MRHFLVSLVLICTLLLTSCQPSATPPEQSFAQFADEIFCEWVSSDSLTLNYTLQEPSRFHIKKLPQGFASPTESDTSQLKTENLLPRLASYQPEKLTAQETILYETLTDYLNLEQEENSFEAFADILNPSSGIQAQLPVLLTEFHWDSADDIEQYFLLLASIPNYFETLLQIEKNKKQSGTLPCRSTMLSLLSQCEDFLSQKGWQTMETCFRETISARFPDRAPALIKKHSDYLQRYVIPSYQHLITGITALLPDAPEDGALASYPKGISYYNYLFRKKSGSTQPVSFWVKKLKNRLAQAEQDLLADAAKDPAAFRTCENYDRHFSSSKEMLDTLQQKMARDFPVYSAKPYQLHSVDSSLENYLSPAFYLTPPIDDTTSNAIYINQAPRYRHSSLFSTLAHEGYPGHLYQNCYFRQKKGPLLRHLLDYPAYTEGYATYAEIYAYRYSGAGDTEIRILQNNAIAAHCLYALCDIGIHRDHWNLSTLSAFLTRHGYPAEANARRIYGTIIDSPASYIPYTIGFLQLEQLRKNFPSDLSFHTYILDMGPTSFSILEKHTPKHSEK